MAMADAPQLKRRVRGEVKRARNAIRALGSSLAELEKVETADRFGTFVIEPDESIQEVESDLGSMLHIAREDHPGQQIEVVVIARQGPDEGDE